MEILTASESLKVFARDYPNLKPVGIISRDTRVYKPSIPAIFSELNFRSDLGIEDGLIQVASACNLEVVGQTAQKILKIQIPTVDPWPYSICDSLEEACGISLPGIKEDTLEAYINRELIRSQTLDLDFIMDIPVTSPAFQGLKDNIIFTSEIKNDPERISFTTLQHREGLGISITRVGNHTSTHEQPCTSLDNISMALDTSLGIKTGQLEKYSNMELSILGLEKLYYGQCPNKLDIITTRFVIQSLAEQNGVRIPINFGQNSTEQFMLSEILLRSMRNIIKNRNNYSTLAFDTNLFYSLLTTLQTNWPLIDNRIKEIAVKAFQLSYGN